ncbi:MAG: HAMP domain-containing histidine kinase [Lachnospiraceae bacterium]|nr:HAMP domain-containing histidine kinase [Lachnospiraceae bacterium]
MKNLTIKTFLMFLTMACFIMGAVYLTFYILTPYAGKKKYQSYIKTKSTELANRCMLEEKAEAENMIYTFASRSGAKVRLITADTYKKQEHIANDMTYPLRFADDAKEYVLLVTVSTERTEDYKRQTLISLPIAFAIALILSFAGAKLTSYYLKRPIVRMSKIAQAMAEQNFDWYCPDERDDEIGALAKSLNTLSDELSAALERLNDKNLYLKNEIALEKERERRRMLFFAGVSHELKTPISVVIGQIDGMRAGIGVYKDRDKYLAKCSDTLNELVGFINEILLVSHIDIGDTNNMQAVKIDRILDETIAIYDGLITEKNIHLDYQVPDNVDFRGDEKLLAKALGNILGNAFNYTPNGGTVKVGLSTSQDGKVKLNVTNFPAHIDDKHLPHLFEAFYHGDTKNTAGSGLGLYITGMVLSMFGAEYSISNTDGGVEFRITQ